MSFLISFILWIVNKLNFHTIVVTIRFIVRSPAATRSVDIRMVLVRHNFHKNLLMMKLKMMNNSMMYHSLNYCIRYPKNSPKKSRYSYPKTCWNQNLNKNLKLFFNVPLDSKLMQIQIKTFWNIHYQRVQKCLARLHNLEPAPLSEFKEKYWWKVKKKTNQIFAPFNNLFTFYKILTMQMAVTMRKHIILYIWKIFFLNFHYCRPYVNALRNVLTSGTCQLNLITANRQKVYFVQLPPLYDSS